MAKKNIKEFVKEHEREIIIGTAAALTGIVAGILLHEGYNSWAVSKLVGDIKKHPSTTLTPYKSHFGDVTGLWISGTTGNPTVTINGINYQNFEEAGFEFIDYCLDNDITKTLDQPINIFMEIENS